MDKTAEIVFIVLTAAVVVSVLIQCAAVFGMLFVARMAQRKVHTLVDDMRIHVLPALNSSRTILEDLSPKLKVVSANLVDVSNRLKTMSGEVSGVVTDVTQRTRAQAAHVDGMLEGTLDQITNATDTIQHGIAIPMRQLTGVMNGVRAALNVMLNRAPSTKIEV